MPDIFFSSPYPKGQVSFTHYLASIVDKPRQRMIEILRLGVGYFLILYFPWCWILYFYAKLSLARQAILFLLQKGGVALQQMGVTVQESGLLRI